MKTKNILKPENILKMKANKLKSLKVTKSKDDDAVCVDVYDIV